MANNLFSLAILACLVYSTLGAICLPCNGKTDTGITIDDAGCKIANCNAPPCPAPRGQNETITFGFKANADFNDLKVSLCGNIAHICVPLPGGLANDSICSMGPACPIKKGNTYTATVSVMVSSKFPTIETTANIKVADDKGNDQGCLAAALQIK